VFKSLKEEARSTLAPVRVMGMAELGAKKALPSVLKVKRKTMDTPGVESSSPAKQAAVVIDTSDAKELAEGQASGNGASEKLQVPRDEYAMVKNIMGKDSPQTALMAVGRLHQSWIAKAGGSFFENKVASENDDGKCEISPLVSYEGEDLAGQFMEPIQLPYYLPSQQEIPEASSFAPQLARRASIHYLNMNEDLAQRELEMELQGHLGKVMDKIQTGDKEMLDYQGPDEKDSKPAADDACSSWAV